MITRPILVILITILSVRCSDSHLKGQITFYGSNQVAGTRQVM